MYSLKKNGSFSSFVITFKICSAKLFQKANDFFETKPTDVKIKSQQKIIGHQKNIPRFFFLIFFTNTELSPTQLDDVGLSFVYITPPVFLL